MGILSYFHSSKPTPEFQNYCEEIQLLTPSTYNPRHDDYASNEENMLNRQGNILENKYSKNVIIENIEEDPIMLASLQATSIESRRLNHVFDRSVYDE